MDVRIAEQFVIYESIGMCPDDPDELEDEHPNSQSTRTMVAGARDTNVDRIV